MEQNSVGIISKATFVYKMGRQKRAVAACFIIVLLSFLLCVVLAFFSGEAVFLLIQALVFLVAGTVQVYQLNKELHRLSVVQRWLFSLSLAGTLLLLFAFFFLLQNRFSWFMIIAGPAAFLFPFVLLETYRLYLQVSYAGAKTWYPSHELSMTFPDIYVNGFPVCFKIIQGEGSKDVLSIDFLPSVRMKPGEVLVDIAQKQKRQGGKEILLANAAGETYHWIFLTRDKLLWNRALDPALTLSQNKIKYGNVIYALRVKENAVDVTLPDDEQE
jgi:hypothetical protein